VVDAQAELKSFGGQMMEMEPQERQLLPIEATLAPVLDPGAYDTLGLDGGGSPQVVVPQLHDSLSVDELQGLTEPIKGECGAQRRMTVQELSDGLAQAGEIQDSLELGAQYITIERLLRAHRGMKEHTRLELSERIGILNGCRKRRPISR
jgi:hypothetical protein